MSSFLALDLLDLGLQAALPGSKRRQKDGFAVHGPAGHHANFAPLLSQAGKRRLQKHAVDLA